MSNVILVVEDDLLIQKLLSRMLKKSGFDGEVMVFSESAPALHYVQEHAGRVVLALLDTMIHPEGDQVFAQALIEHAPHIQIVASSGHSESDLRSPQHFGDVPLAGILSKPFGLADIRRLFAQLNL